MHRGENSEKHHMESHGKDGTQADAPMHKKGAASQFSIDAMRDTQLDKQYHP
jgi:hypothetical protein